jgi:biotin-dependent carboxylase-like uncharacterized protein
MSLHVLAPGLHSLVVDFGRPHHRSLGVPLGGAADRGALALGNALVGNAPNSPALEITLAGPTLRAEAEVGCVLYGAPFDFTSDRQRGAMGKTFTLEPGEILHIGGCKKGMRAYLCVPGGFDAPTILESRSAFEPLAADGVLRCRPSRLAARFIREETATPDAGAPFRVVPGTQASWFAESEFYSQSYVVTPASNRMGLRLEGRPLTVPDRELVSEAVCPGTVQVTRDGQCIVLGVDAQTIGGYPKIAQVISADLDRLGQLRPGDAVTFVQAPLAEAEQLYRQRVAECAQWLRRLAVTCEPDAGGPTR